MCNLFQGFFVYFRVKMGNEGGYSASNDDIGQDSPIERDNFQSHFDTQFIFIAFILKVSSSVQYLNLSTESCVY